jgi:hypothetical protein
VQKPQTFGLQIQAEKAHARDIAPGRLKLVTMPAMTGSPVLTKTIGISVVAALATGVAGVFAAITAPYAVQDRQPLLEGDRTDL